MVSSNFLSYGLLQSKSGTAVIVHFVWEAKEVLGVPRPGELIVQSTAK